MSIGRSGGRSPGDVPGPTSLRAVHEPGPAPIAFDVQTLRAPGARSQPGSGRLRGGASTHVFTLMGFYVFFVGGLVPPSIPRAERRREWQRSWIGTLGYLVAAALAFVWVPIALVVFVVIPLVFVVPNLLRGNEADR
jgi:hypothetical protein